MKRYGNLFEKIISYENLFKAHERARQNKKSKPGVKYVDNHLGECIKNLHDLLNSGNYKTSPYQLFTIIDKGKEREIANLPYYPDRIVHWAIMQVIEPILVNSLIPFTYSALPNRGSHCALKLLKKYLREGGDDTKYCLKIDVKKFFPNINKSILKNLLRNKIKDIRLLSILDESIDSYKYGEKKGIPIGSLTSQYFGNYYLYQFGHWLKETKKKDM